MGSVSIHQSSDLEALRLESGRLARYLLKALQCWRPAASGRPLGRLAGGSIDNGGGLLLL